MSKAAIVYWSQTGNTEAMAQAVKEGAEAAGLETSLFHVSELTAAEALGYDVLALGCPAMGAEDLEEMEFAPFFDGLSGSLSGRKLGLFGSYGWGGGQWMVDWESRVSSAGGQLVSEGVTAAGSPDSSDLEACRALGRALAG